MRSTEPTAERDAADPLRALVRGLTRPGRALLVLAIGVLVLSPAVLHMSDSGPDKLRWRMYADAAHLNIRYEVVEDDGDRRPADISQVDRWLAGQHRGAELPRALCDQVDGAHAVRRLIGDRIEETWPC